MSSRPSLKQREAKGKITTLIFEIDEFLLISDKDEDKASNYLKELKGFEDSLLTKPLIKSKEKMIESLTDYVKVPVVKTDKPISPFSVSRNGLKEVKEEVKEEVKPEPVKQIKKTVLVKDEKDSIPDDKSVKFSTIIEGRLIEAVRVRAKNEFKDIKDVIEELIWDSFSKNEIEEANQIFKNRTITQMKRKENKKK